jgi:hypothetical protein
MLKPAFLSVLNHAAGKAAGKLDKAAKSSPQAQEHFHCQCTPRRRPSLKGETPHLLRLLAARLKGLRKK